LPPRYTADTYHALTCWMKTLTPTIGHIRWQVILIAAGIALLATMLIYVALNLTTEVLPARGGTYIEGRVGQPRSINPLLYQANEVDRDLCALVFNKLYYLDSSGALRPDLAARPVEMSPDGLTYSVTLRTDVRWHDGQPFTADDVLFTIDLIRHPDFPGSDDLARLWRTVEISRVHAAGLAFRLKEPFAPFPDYLALGIVPAHILRQVPPPEVPVSEFNFHPVGTGLFKVEEVGGARGQIDHVTLVANPLYSNQPYLGRIVFRFFADDAAVFNAYRAGQVQGIARVSHQDLPRLRQYPRLNVFSAPLTGYAVIFFNLSSAEAPFFQDKQVRQALMAALDRQQIIDRALNGNGRPVYGPFLPSAWAYDPSLPIPKPDASQVGALLDVAGWTLAASRVGAAEPVPGTAAFRNKEGRPFAFTLLTSNDATHVALAQAVAEQWAAIGVSVTVKSAPMLVTNHLVPRSYEAVLVNLSQAGDPDPYPFWHETQVSSGQNYAGYKDRDLSEVLEQARRTNDWSVRRQLYQRFQQMFIEAAPALPLVQPIYTFAVDERVRGVQVGPLVDPSDRFRTVTDWSIVMRRVIVSER